MRQRLFALVFLLAVFGVLALLLPRGAPAPALAVHMIATELRNPRGVAVLPDGRLLVVEAGDGASRTATGGHIRIFADTNRDGDYDDVDERTMVICCVGGYNSLTRYGTGQDEVGGLGDVALLDDGHIFYTQDDPLGSYAPDGSSNGIAIMGLTPAPEWRRYIVAVRNATTNALVYDPQARLLYMAESGNNRISSVTLDGDVTPLVDLPTLAHGQQAVPAGLALDPRTGDVLVALLSGQIRDYLGTVIAYMPQDARIIRLNPTTREWHDEIVGLTTAVDVAVDEFGNIFTVELATGWAAAVIPRDFPLFDPDAPPDAGGYPRFSGRVTMYPTDRGTPIVLAQGLDEPTNITYHHGALYVSVGQGTPGRPIMGPDGRTRISGTLHRITGF
jgi:hypothetical protein